MKRLRKADLERSKKQKIAKPHNRWSRMYYVFNSEIFYTQQGVTFLPRSSVRREGLPPHSRKFIWSKFNKELP